MLQPGTQYLFFKGQQMARYKKAIASTQAVEEPVV
jgi:hypothetical protein